MRFKKQLFIEYYNIKDKGVEKIWPSLTIVEILS